MYENRFLASEVSVLNLKTQGSLQLIGWEQPTVEIVSGDHMTRSEEQGGEISVYSVGDCKVSLPAAVRVVVEKVGGEVLARGVDAPVEIGRVGGNIYVESCGALTVEKIGGNASIKQAKGPLKFMKIGGNVSAEGVVPHLVVNKAGGNVNLQVVELAGSVKAGGNINLAVQVIGDDVVELDAGGDIRLFVPSDLDARIEITSGSEEIHIKVGQQANDLSQETFRFGEGSRELRLDAGGSVFITDSPWSSEAFGHGFDFHFNFNFDKFDQDIERITGHAARAAERASQAAEAGMRQAEKHIEEVMRNMGGYHPGHQPHPEEAGFAANQDEPAREGVSEEERLTILRMLQEKKITLEQAEQLLEALEGRK